VGKAFHGSIDTIAAEATCSPQQVRIAVTAALRCLHRTSVTDRRSVTAALVDTYQLFGLEATYHIAGLFEEARLYTDREVPWSETMARFAPHLRPFGAVLDKWRQAGERP